MCKRISNSRLRAVQQCSRPPRRASHWTHTQERTATIERILSRVVHGFGEDKGDHWLYSSIWPRCRQNSSLIIRAVNKFSKSKLGDPSALQTGTLTIGCPSMALLTWHKVDLDITSSTHGNFRIDCSQTINCMSANLKSLVYLLWCVVTV